MARIFYHRGSGDIYGVHPGEHDPRKIKLPGGVVWIDVPEEPDAIAWPDLPDGRPGTEHTSRVVGGALALGDDLPPSLDEEVEAFLNQPNIRALIDAINDGSLPVAQNRTFPEIVNIVAGKRA